MDAVAAQIKLTLFPLLAISLLFLPFLQATDFKYCDEEANYVVKVSGIDISPNPVARGKPATFTISASTGQAISGGKAVIDVSYYGVHIHKETHPLCEETSCPISAGNFVLSHNQVLPGFTPPLFMCPESGDAPFDGIFKPTRLFTICRDQNLDLLFQWWKYDWEAKTNALVSNSRTLYLNIVGLIYFVWLLQGSYTLKMTLSADGLPQLTCISFNFKIGFGTSGSSVSDI